MDKAAVTLSVFFEDPFWIGILERVQNGQLSACKITFGAEPKDYEVLEFLLENYNRLRFSPAVETVVKEMRRNPKRMQREAHRHMEKSDLGTKSQQALKLQQEQNKLDRREISKARREEEALRRFEQKQQKKKEKHRGR